jgi:hypothetical protein
MVSYAIVDSMNGTVQPNARADQVWVNNRGELSKTHERAVFIDIGRVRDSSYHVYYDRQLWHDPPPVRHHDGATIGYADAHAEYVKWKGSDTIEFGRNDSWGDDHDLPPQTPEGRLDLAQMQREVYGRLGY